MFDRYGKGLLLVVTTCSLRGEDSLINNCGQGSMSS